LRKREAFLKIRLTKRIVEAAAADPEKHTYLWDQDIRGFGVRIQPTGRKTYFMQFRNQQRVTRKIKIGVHGNITTEKARETAIQLSLKISAGQDPAAEKKKKTVAPTIKIHTLNDLTQEYLHKYAIHKKERSVAEDKKLLKIILPSMGHTAVSEIKRSNIETLHLSRRKTPYHANRMLALLSKMFSLAVVWGIRRDNPVKGITRFQEKKRESWLTNEELKRLWQVLDQHSYNPISSIIKLLILTGARKSEVLNMTWEQIDLDSNIWTKPSHLTKQKKTERLPLSIDTLKLLKSVRTKLSLDSKYVFPGREAGRPFKRIEHFWAKTTKEAGLEDVRIHDLRHTYASHLVSKGLSLSIVGKLLGHTQAATTQRYAHLQDEPLRAATEMFGSVLKEDVGEVSS
jgi:integrase